MGTIFYGILLVKEGVNLCLLKVLVTIITVRSIRCLE